MIALDIKNSQKQIEKRQAAIKSMAYVLSLPSGSPERWRATFDHFLRQRPDAAVEAHFVAEHVRENRKLMDKFASTKHGRHTMSTPSFLIDMLKSTDPEYFIGKGPKELSGARHLGKLKKAFPFYFYPEVI